MEKTIVHILNAIGIILIFVGFGYAILFEGTILHIIYGVISGCVFFGFAAILNILCQIFDEMKRLADMVERIKNKETK
jgi:hypothetical protein